MILSSSKALSCDTDLTNWSETYLSLKGIDNTLAHFLIMSFTIIPVCMMANDHLLSGNSYYIQKSYCIRGKSIFSGWENVFKNLWLHHNVHTYMDQLGTVPYCTYSMWKSMCSCQVNVNFCPPSYFHASGQSHVTWNPNSNSFTSQRKLIGLKFPPHICVSLHGKIV